MPNTPAAAPAAKKGTGPIEKFRDQGVNVSVFPNVVAREDGSEATYYNTVVESRYRDKEGNWQSGSSFSKQQIYALRFLIDEALRAISAAEKGQKSSEE